MRFCMMRPIGRCEEPAARRFSCSVPEPPAGLKIVRRDEGASLDAVSANMVEAIGFTADDRVLAAVPLCHSYGMEHGLLCPIWAGSCTHLYDRFDLPAAMDELTDGAVTVFPGVPFMFETLAGGAAERPPIQSGSGVRIRPAARFRARSSMRFSPSSACRSHSFTARPKSARSPLTIRTSPRSIRPAWAGR